jgi:ferredoxin
MDERWRVTVDRDACMGSGMCAATSPKHFRLDAGKSRPVEDDIEPDDVVVDAATICPAEAIAVYDTEGRQLAP